MASLISRLTMSSFWIRWAGEGRGDGRMTVVCSKGPKQRDDMSYSRFSSKNLQEREGRYFLSSVQRYREGLLVHLRRNWGGGGKGKRGERREERRWRDSSYTRPDRVYSRAKRSEGEKESTTTS